MKIFKLMVVALVAMLGFTACEKDCDHDFIEHDHSADLVGTWTCLTAGYSEALVINADGSVVSTGIENGKYWEDVKGNIKTVNNKMTMTFEDDDNWEGRFEMVAGVAFAIYEENGESFTFQYCANDLADEIVGMWVCNDGPMDQENEIIVRTYDENGKVATTGVYTGDVDANPILNSESNYKVIGDLVFKEFPKDIADKTGITHNAERLIYTPKATASGDIMTILYYLPAAESNVELRSSYLRINQSLDLAGQKYDYIKTYVSNVKGEDKDINFMGYTFNFAKMDGSGLDKMLKALLFAVEFPDANTLGYSYQMNGNKETYNSPIVVEGNKMTIKMSAKVPTLKDVVLYAFQDADCSQMHFYMHKTAFVNFYTNMQAMLMEATDEQFDINNAEAVNAIYDNINNAVETINVSLVMSK